jgi:hypothetical protein
MAGMPGGPMGMDTGEGPSEAELQAMLAQMREAPVEQVLVEVVNALLQAVQVKLGRPDARLLLDAVAAMAAAAGGRIDPALLGQVQQAVSQLRLAQVDAEGGAPASAAAQDTGSAGSHAAGGARATTAPHTVPPAPTPPPTSAAGGTASRLWVPGR